MAWFSKKQPVAVVEPEQTVAQQEKRKVLTGPRLAVLTPDIAGISSFRLSVRDDAADAENMVAGLRADVRRGTHAFWAMHEKPVVDESMHVETLVLIRAKAESDLVYVVSFLDLESALSFTRFEVRRGLYIGNVMIYWAAFTQIREELEGVSILPSIAPPAEKYLAPEPSLAPPLPQPQAQAPATVAPPVAEPEPALESIAEAEARKAVERYLEANPEKAAEPIAEQPPVIEETIAVVEPPVIEEAPAPVLEPLPVFDDQPVTEEAAVADALVLQHPPVGEPAVEAEPIAEPAAEITQPEPEHVAKRKPAPWAPKRRWATREARQRAEAEQQPEVVGQTSTEVVIEMPEIVAEEPALLAEEPQVTPPEPMIVDQAPVAEVLLPQAETALEPRVLAEEPTVLAEEAHATNGHAPQSVLEVQESEALQVIADRVTTYAGDEEAEADTQLDSEEIEMRGPAIDPANGLPQSEKYSEFDIALEVERLLKNRKWESKEGPFRGFKSPPGRF